MKLHATIERWGYPLLLSAAVILIFAPLIFSLTHFKAGVVVSDFPAFIELAQSLQERSGGVPAYHVAHSLWQWLVIAVNGLFGISFRMSAFLVTLSSILAAALVLYFWLEPVLRANNLTPAWAVFAAIGLNLVDPLSLLVPVDRRFSAGYIGTITYNNPTIILLRPLAMLQFILAIRCFQQMTASWGQTAVAALVTLLATFAKPSFAICILPALSLVAAYRWLKKQWVDWRLLLAGFIVPSVAMLAWQFLLAYGAPGQTGIIFFPFGAIGANSGFLGIKFLLSIIFPLVVAVLYFQEARRDMRLVLAWLSFFMGVLFAYFLAEGPPRTSDGNFIWSARIALLILFCASTLFLLEKLKRIGWKALLATAAWIAHVGYGIAYYWRYFTTQKFI